ncbi:hypothetical protein [Usitatibacter palustris]|uniref:Uncharacterized protein n=1 Tax=Usitatibacter palustris TaxID=2732487 RepID=A0A6M4H6G2_9PROT|nr:hypothetical protein [Usitatibacter palustris]QJR14932.1 hypothetical protein DSM104440_01747 [Usitatibacter palustris]
MHKKAIQSAALAFVAMAAVFGAGSASARQCVANKGGYLVDVKWYPSDAIHLDDKGKLATSKPVKQAKGGIPVLQGSCNETNEQLTAVVAVVACIGYVPMNGGAPVNCSPVATRGPVEVLPGTLPASASCDKGCMHKPHLATKVKDDAALGVSWGAPPQIIVVGTIPAGKTLELSGTTGRVVYSIK